MHFEETRPGRDVYHQSYVGAVRDLPNLGPAEYWHTTPRTEVDFQNVNV